MDKKVELLAPCGDFECFNAAISAGADAVYLGGDKFGARAYANNFSSEEIIEAIRIAHILSRKVYLTVNTLVKESEMNDLIPFMSPLVEAGLDGVIVQDLGVFFTLRENFPSLELHASTQMTITGIYGARFLKEIGATRIVPARELSLEEIIDIKKETGLEIETFIHGAMCYAYSGQCLFSSILGGRSGNRGRCAGPCRLPYEVGKKNVYPLSLKDMYTLNSIPQLIDAGIDSFKIEGRMKSPEYVAGVTAMYRKYIDLYLSNPKADYKVSKEDENLIRNLYIRSDICEGYYNQHNNKNMVSVSEPGYKGSSDEVLAKIKAEYIDVKPVLDIVGKAVVLSGKPCSLEIQYKEICVSAEGDVVSEALNRPMLEQDIYDKLSKTGNTFFKFKSLFIETDNKSFIPVKVLNELRRNVLNQLEEKIIYKAHNELKYEALNYYSKENDVHDEAFASVQTYDQFEAVEDSEFIKGIYINFDLFINESIYEKIISNIKNNTEKKYYIYLPAIWRKRSYGYKKVVQKLIDSNVFAGFLVKNMEEYMMLQEMNYKGECISDYSIYSWNIKATETLNTLFTRTTFPVELNKREISDVRDKDREIVLYTRLPLMYSANCLQKTFGNCLNDKSGKQNIFYITDRQNNIIPVLQNCFHCFNVLYNPVVMSLHNQMDSIKKDKIDVYRLDFTLESKKEIKQILNFYEDLLLNEIKNDFPFKDYTAGHFKRGVM